MARPNTAQLIDTLLMQLPYANKPAVKAHLMDLVAQVPSLGPKSATFVHSNGQTSQLIQVFGTVPIYHKGAQYNIPINIWLLYTYPQHPPMCYVTPTADMAIKEKHKHVDPQGLIYLPYLNQWNMQSNLAVLVATMSSVFSEMPPCYAKPAHQYRASTSQGSMGGSMGNMAQMNPYGQPIQPSLYPMQPVQQQQQMQPMMGQMAQPMGGQQQQVNQMNSAAAQKDKLVGELTDKCKEHLRAYNNELSDELESLLTMQNKTQAASAAIEQGVTDMKTEKAQLQAASEAIDKKQAEVTKWLADNASLATIDPDSAVTPKDTWSKQLLECIAEDHSLDDTIDLTFHLLEDGVIDLECFIKVCRKLSRDQFMPRALGIRIQQRQDEARAPVAAMAGLAVGGTRMPPPPAYN